jgi:hypothetical protein
MNLGQMLAAQLRSIATSQASCAQKGKRQPFASAKRPAFLEALDIVISPYF